MPFLIVLGARISKDPRLVRSSLLGKPAPAFALPRIDGPGQLSSADLAGRVYVVNFWADVTPQAGSGSASPSRPNVR